MGRHAGFGEAGAKTLAKAMAGRAAAEAVQLLLRCPPPVAAATAPRSADPPLPVPQEAARDASPATVKAAFGAKLEAAAAARKAARAAAKATDASREALEAAKTEVRQRTPCTPAV